MFKIDNYLNDQNRYFKIKKIASFILILFYIVNEQKTFSFCNILFFFQVLIPFSRDTFVLKHFDYNSASPPKSYIRGRLGMDEFAVNYPPNGVIPFHGFAMYGK